MENTSGNMGDPIRSALSFLRNAVSLVASREATFQKIDADGSGDICWEEWESAVGAGTDEQLLRGVFDEIDDNNDGKLTPDEFEKSLSGLRELRK